MKLKPEHIIPRQLCNSSGLTLIGLMVAVACLFVVLIVALFLLWEGKEAAYEITIKHDLRTFIEAQMLYFDENNEYLGRTDDFFRSKSESETPGLTLRGFTPSPGVVITVISEDPFVVKAMHENTETVFEHNFKRGSTIKTGDKNDT